MNIKNVSRFFSPTDNNKKYFCRNCCNFILSEKKYNEHLQFCQTYKAQILMPSINKYIAI